MHLHLYSSHPHNYHMHPCFYFIHHHMLCYVSSFLFFVHPHFTYPHLHVLLLLSLFYIFCRTPQVDTYTTRLVLGFIAYKHHCSSLATSRIIMFTDSTPSTCFIVTFGLVLYFTYCTLIFTVHTQFTSCTPHVIHAPSYFCIALLFSLI